MLDFSIRYLHVLKTKLAGLNLTNILDPDEFYSKQILDSINPYIQSPLFQEQVAKSKLVVDIGFGGGFPILPLAKMLPEIKFVGIESKRKKVDAVKLIADELGIQNVTLIHSRLEDIVIDRPAAITFKAVGLAKDYLSILQSTVKGNYVFFYKGPSFLELEGKDLEKLKNYWLLDQIEEISVPNTQQRNLVSFVGQNVPRGTSNKLVKLSHFL